MPAEWDRHQGTWLSWPHNPETWPGYLAGAQAALTTAVIALAESENVHINVNDEVHRAAVAARFAGKVPKAHLHLHVIPTNDAWCRDHGSIFVRRDEALIGLDFRFNAWGGKYPPFDLDDAAAAKMNDALGVPTERIEMVLEGGSIEVNGAGTVLTTEQCLLNANRNPRMSRNDIEAALRRYLGVAQVLWLGDGIDGDDTDGHIDDLTRFVAVDRVITMVEPNRFDVNHKPLTENLAHLRSMRLPHDRPLEIVEIPMPAPLSREGRRLPASYANFYIGNEVVLVPIFACEQDALAIDVIGNCFPGRSIVPIDCREVVVGLGTFHCLTQQIPA
jgi:agmatine deiminase